jgi:hypothetical protein
MTFDLYLAILREVAGHERAGDAEAMRLLASVLDDLARSVRDAAARL